MKRRKFIKYSSFIIPAAAVIGIGNPFTKNVFAAGNSADQFSISVITNQPSKTIHLIEQAINKSVYGSRALQFTEYRLKGRHVGDIAYIKSQTLIDFRKEQDEFSHILNESANSLSLPATFDDPVLLRFSSQEKLLKPAGVNIFRGDKLINYFSLNNKNKIYRIEGLKGHVDIKIENDTVKIISAACKHKTCMGMEAISKPGENLVCIPNQVSISIAGRSTTGVDSVTF